MRFLLSLSALGFVWLAEAQIVSPLPTDTDLKAAYCMAFYNSQESTLRAFTQAGNPPGVTEAAGKVLGQSASDLRRVRLYLMPRMQYLDTNALIGAKKSGEEDVARAYKLNSACTASCETIQCVASCPDSQEISRLKSCIGARFLPF